MAIRQVHSNPIVFKMSFLNTYRTANADRPNSGVNELQSLSCPGRTADPERWLVLYHHAAVFVRRSLLKTFFVSALEMSHGFTSWSMAAAQMV
jgi:hypothetical protein